MLRMNLRAVARRVILGIAVCCGFTVVFVLLVLIAVTQSAALAQALHQAETPWTNAMGMHTALTIAMALPVAVRAVARRSLRWYLRQLHYSPFGSRAVSAGIIFFLADLSGQLLSGAGRYSPFDLSRLLRYSSYGFVVMGPFLYSWYSLMHEFGPEDDVKGALQKALFEQFTLEPTCIAMYMIYDGIVQRRPVRETYLRLAAQFGPLWFKNAVFWLPANFSNYYIGTPDLRVLFANLCSLFWNIYFSIKVNTRRGAREQLQSRKPPASTVLPFTSDQHVPAGRSAAASAMSNSSSASSNASSVYNHRAKTRKNRRPDAADVASFPVPLLPQRQLNVENSSAVHASVDRNSADTFDPEPLPPATVLMPSSSLAGSGKLPNAAASASLQTANSFTELDPSTLPSSTAESSQFSPTMHTPVAPRECMEQSSWASAISQDPVEFAKSIVSDRFASRLGLMDMKFSGNTSEVPPHQAQQQQPQQPDGDAGYTNARSMSSRPSGSWSTNGIGATVNFQNEQLRTSPLQIVNSASNNSVTDALPPDVQHPSRRMTATAIAVSATASVVNGAFLSSVDGGSNVSIVGNTANIESAEKSTSDSLAGHGSQHATDSTIATA